MLGRLFFLGWVHWFSEVSGTCFQWNLCFGTCFNESTRGILGATCFQGYLGLGHMLSGVNSGILGWGTCSGILGLGTCFQGPALESWVDPFFGGKHLLQFFMFASAFHLVSNLIPDPDASSSMLGPWFRPSFFLRRWAAFILSGWLLNILMRMVLAHWFSVCSSAKPSSSLSLSQSICLLTLCFAPIFSWPDSRISLPYVHPILLELVPQVFPNLFLYPENT